MSEKEKLLTKLKKVQELATRGNSGEKENAETMLKTLMKKYGISEEELTELEIPVFRKFSYNQGSPFSKKLLNQIIYSVVGDVDKYKIYHQPKLGVDCTRLQAAEIEGKFYFYNSLLKKDLDTFYIAFINKHMIFHESSGTCDAEDEGYDYEKLESMMSGMSDESYHLQLGS